MTIYRVTVEPAGRHWQAVVQGIGGAAGVQLRDLRDVEPKVRRLIVSNSSVDSMQVDLDINVCLPPVIQQHLWLVESLSEDLQHEMAGAVAAMRSMGLPEVDIASILAEWYTPPRALTITNREIVEDGLANHPHAVGVRWDDHGFALTLKCRAHVEATRATYRDAPPEDTNVLVYPAETFQCDLCQEGDDLDLEPIPQEETTP